MNYYSFKYYGEKPKDEREESSASAMLSAIDELSGRHPYNKSDNCSEYDRGWHDALCELKKMLM